MTDEPPSLVDAWVRKHRPAYPIVCLKDRALEEFLGVQFFPTAAVIAPDGKLLYSGSAGSVGGPLGKALDEAEKGPLFPKAFEKACALMRAEAWDESYAVLLELIEKGRLEDAERETAARLQAYLEELAAGALAQATKLLDEGRVLHALESVQVFAEADPPFPATADCAALLERIEAVPELKKELAGGKLLQKAEALEEELEFLDAFKAYRSIIKKYRGTRVAVLAEERARALMEGGQPGWSAHCQSCRMHEDRRACERHREKLKL